MRRLELAYAATSIPRLQCTIGHLRAFGKLMLIRLS
jgi:hypothetical protein